MEWTRRTPRPVSCVVTEKWKVTTNSLQLQACSEVVPGDSQTQASHLSKKILTYCLGLTSGGPTLPLVEDLPKLKCQDCEM